MRGALILLVKVYRLLLRQWLGMSCRFEPTCSAYSIQALERHGAWGGSYLTLARIGRCHPWCDGGHDPVPERPFDNIRAWAHGAKRHARASIKQNL